MPAFCAAVSEDDFADYVEAGMRAFGLSSSLYRPGDGAGKVAARAEATIAAYDAVYGSAKASSGT